MSDEQNLEQPDILDLGPEPGANLEALLNFMAPEAFAEEPVENDEAAGAPAAGDPEPAPATQGTPGAEPAAGAPAAGDVGSGGVAGEGFDASELTGTWATVTENIETRAREAVELEVVGEVQDEFSNYFGALNTHPRALVGQTVPSAKGGDAPDEVLRDSADAKDWQDAIRETLQGLVAERIAQRAEADKGRLGSIHSSIALFQQNPDLLPGSKQFNLELARSFAELAAPYKKIVDDKFVGYSIPVEPLLAAARKLTAPPAPAAPAAPSAQQQRAAEQARNTVGQFSTPAEEPQAGIPSSAGSSAPKGDDMSAFWGAFGLPNINI